EILTAAGQRVGGRHFRVTEPNQGKNDARRQECEGREAKGSQGDDAQSRINVGTDRRVAPHVRAVDRDIAPKLAAGDCVRGVGIVRRRLHQAPTYHANKRTCPGRRLSPWSGSSSTATTSSLPGRSCRRPRTSSWKTRAICSLRFSPTMRP